MLHAKLLSIRDVLTSTVQATGYGDTSTPTTPSTQSINPTKQYVLTRTLTSKTSHTALATNPSNTPINRVTCLPSLCTRFQGSTHLLEQRSFKPTRPPARHTRTFPQEPSHKSQQESSERYGSARCNIIESTVLPIGHHASSTTSFLFSQDLSQNCAIGSKRRMHTSHLHKRRGHFYPSLSRNVRTMAGMEDTEGSDSSGSGCTEWNFGCDSDGRVLCESHYAVK
jgi:hypothetical protein